MTFKGPSLVGAHAMLAAAAFLAVPPLAAHSREGAAQNDEHQTAEPEGIDRKLTKRQRDLIAKYPYEFALIEEMCAAGCVTWPDLAKAATKDDVKLPDIITVVIDVQHIDTRSFKYALHASEVRDPRCVIIEVDPEIMQALIGRFKWEKEFKDADEDGIEVLRNRKDIRVNERDVAREFIGRRIVVRGKLRLLRTPIPSWAEDGQIRIRLASADDLVRVPKG